VVCIILSIASVFSCSFLCNLGLISFSHEEQPSISISTSHSHEHKGKHQPLGHQEKGHSHSHKSNHHHHNSQKEEGCCNDLTQQFYSSLVSTTGVQLSIIHAELYKLISTLTFVDLTEINLKAYLLVSSRFEHMPNGPPGYAGHRIRVLFCSFLI
jgi:hypothetical protein